MARSSAADAALTARRVVEAATDLFAREGYAGVSLDDVAQAAAVTRGAVYHHYASKIGLFSAVAARLQEGVAQEVVRRADLAGPDPLAILRAGCHGFLDAITSGPALRILLVEAPAAVGWQQWRQWDESYSAAHLRLALAEVGVPADLCEATTAQLSGAMNEAALWVAHHDDPPAALVAAHRVLDRLLDVLPRLHPDR